MAEESTTPDVVELTGRQFEAANSRGADAVMSRFPPDDTLPAGFLVYEGPAAIRAFLGEWWDSFEELAWLEAVDFRDIDGEHVVVTVENFGRGKVSGLEVHSRGANLFRLCDGRVTRLVSYWDRDDALADLGLWG